MKPNWTRAKLIEAYLTFFESNGHARLPSSSLVPENDPTVLFTTAGMHPLVPYLLGQPHPLGKRLCSVQKCIRTQDIDEVGDEVHHTFFEMLGNWSLGNYWKEEAINFSYAFLTKILQLAPAQLGVSVFAGNTAAPQDTVSATVWKKNGFSDKRIYFLKDNWWGPAGNSGPCGPDTEMFYWNDESKPPVAFDPSDARWVEIWNDVFMEYDKTADGKFKPLSQQNVDTGMGVERTLAVLTGQTDNYQTEIFRPLINEIARLCAKPYDSRTQKAMRIIADHVRAAVFILADDHAITPTNVGQGYVLRRLIRRAARFGIQLGITEPFMPQLARIILAQYPQYPELNTNKTRVLSELQAEEHKFAQTLSKGLKKFEQLAAQAGKTISGEEAFLLFQSFGFPIEMTVELSREHHKTVDTADFQTRYRHHQEQSRSASAGVFKSGLADSSTATTRLHTATHLLNEALRQVLGDTVHQKGSNITPERLRFDFNFSRKLTTDEIKQIEDLVNAKIKADLPMTQQEMTLQDAQKSGAQSEFGAKYPPRVWVYTLADLAQKRGWFSREICTGPHVKSTREIGRFKIVKEESSAAGIRRIKAIVTD